VPSSSGSTGAPKRVVRTHANLLFELARLVEAFDVTDEDRFLGAAPFSPVNGLVRPMMTSMYAGATLHPLRSITDARPTYSVEWEPEGGGPFPSFAGALAVDDVDENSFRLILAGHYDAPLGAPGEAFDAIVGSWIARASARELLRTIARYIETSARAGLV